MKNKVKIETRKSSCFEIEYVFSFLFFSPLSALKFFIAIEEEMVKRASRRLGKRSGVKGDVEMKGNRCIDTG